MKPTRKWQKWTDSEDRFLLRHYKIMSDKEMANLLGRTETSVRWRREKKNLVRKRPCPKCGATDQIGVVSTYIPSAKSTKTGFFCRNCFTEYLENGKILPPYKGDE